MTCIIQDIKMVQDKNVKIGFVLKDYKRTEIW